MPETSAVKNKRNRHFWKWVTETKKIGKQELNSNKQQLQCLKREHAVTFPALYQNCKGFSVQESIKSFHRKLLMFNSRLKEDPTFDYTDEAFETLGMFAGEISDERSQAFEKHYFAGYKSFTKHGGKFDHQDYQKYYLQRSFTTQKRIDKVKKYAIKRSFEKKVEVLNKETTPATTQKEEEFDHLEQTIHDRRQILREERIATKKQRLQLKEVNRKKREEREALKEAKRKKRKERAALKEAEKKKREEQKVTRKNQREQSKRTREELKNYFKCKNLTGQELTQEARESLQVLRQKRKEMNSKTQTFVESLERISVKYKGSLRESEVSTHSIGKFGAFKCKLCQSLLWKDERKTICCNAGQTPAIDFSELKDGLKSLYDTTSPYSRRFLENITGFNALFSFTSFNTSNTLQNKKDVSICYKIQGKIYHKIGILKPELIAEKDRPFWKNTNAFLDLYFYHDKDQQLKLRMQKFMRDDDDGENSSSKRSSTIERRKREKNNILENEKILSLLFDYLTEHNACLSGMLKELETCRRLIKEHLKKSDAVPSASITLKAADGINTREHKGVYHLPTSSAQVGGIVDLGSNKDPLQILISSPLSNSQHPIKFVNHNNFFYDAFQYPLLIPNGDIGYSYTMHKRRKPGITTAMKNDRLSPAMFYSSLYMEREGIFNHITKGRRLFQQFVVDNYVKMETNKLCYFELNQSKIRKERLDILSCTDTENNKASGTGQRVILPGSFVGGPRYMKERQQDVLAYVSYYGSPDYFITFTMNPKWPELREAMDNTGSASTRCLGDRPDLVSRIFKLKVDSLTKDLTQGKIFGQVKAHLYSIEWQKRGLPHAHILLWMDERVTADTVAQLIVAEIPDKNKEPRLHEIVTKCMIHGPCKGYDDSQPCCQGKNKTSGKCGKNFPKTCRSDLLFGNNGYPEYKRRSIGEGGHSFKMTIKKEEKVVDNSWVVPYNPYLCLKYNAHINVECSNSIKCIAYLTKYVNKGCDRILFCKSVDGETVNEVKNYQEARFVNANEATWKIFKFEIHKSYPPVMTLDLHLEGENEIFYDERTSRNELERRIHKDTQLTSFFKLCSQNTFAASLHYHELPHHFVYNAKVSCWEERQGSTFSLGRIRAVTTKTVELFYLRLLLTHKPGPTSYEDLRTIEGVMYPSYREAVKALGLLSDEETWRQTILELINFTNDRNRLRETYASMLVFSDLEDQSGIWEETKDLFASDYLHKNKLTEYNDEIYLDALDDIQKHVWNCGGGAITEYGLPASRGGQKTSDVIRREKSYNTESLKENIKVKEPMLNDKQKQVYDTALFRVEHGHRYENNGIFVNAAGGTGKSFVLNLLLDTVRSQGKIALAVASSGIAATVLHGGRTAHNMFKIPLMEYNETKACAVKKGSELAKLLKMTSLIVWDEVVMANKNTLTALDITLRDILENNKFMGGKVFVCAGDFRQILPVIRGGGKNDELEYCIKSSYMWGDITKLELTENVRLKKSDTKNIKFAQKLLEIGSRDDGTLELEKDFGVQVKTRDALIDAVYGDLEDNHLNVSYFEQRAIISPTNDDVDSVNLMIYDKSKEKEVTYYSADKAVDEGADVQISVFNAMTSPSLPPHKLQLKIGCVAMVIRNICPPKLCNGTRILITNLQKHIVVGKILGGSYRGEQVMIPRITLETQDTPVNFKRKQFPLKLSYAMTINKSQGQTFERCGVLLDTVQCFAHGQFYVACSRVTSWDSLIIYTGWHKVNEGYRMKPVTNCVHKELFTDQLVHTQAVLPASTVTVDEEQRIAEEEPEMGIVPIPKDVYRISEEDAINMILPEYVFEEENISNDQEESNEGETSITKKEMEEIFLSLKEEMAKKQEEILEEIKETIKRKINSEEEEEVVSSSPSPKKIKVVDVCQ